MGCTLRKISNPREATSPREVPERLHAGKGWFPLTEGRTFCPHQQGRFRVCWEFKVLPKYPHPMPRVPRLLNQCSSLSVRYLVGWLVSLALQPRDFDSEGLALVLYRICAVATREQRFLQSHPGGFLNFLSCTES